MREQSAALAHGDRRDNDDIWKMKLVAAMHRSMKIGLKSFAVAVAFLALSPLAHAASGTISIRAAKAGVVFGVTKAKGTLHFQGQDYPLSIGGITAGTVGIGVTRLRGHAYNLRSPADVVGNYTVTSVSVAVVGGGKVARLQNSYSAVYLQLEGPAVGLELSVGVAGVTISIP